MEYDEIINVYPGTNIDELTHLFVIRKGFRRFAIPTKLLINNITYYKYRERNQTSS